MTEEEKPVLDTVLGERSFFKSISRSRPVGLHRYFHVLSMQQVIKRETGVLVPVDSIWAKLEACYNLDALESLEIEGYDSSDSDASHIRSVPSPQPEENLMRHPFFRSEFQLPWREYDSLMAVRRLSGTSPPESPALDRRRSRRKSTQTGDLDSSRTAGLYGGNSESSALTDSDNEAHMEVEVSSAKPSRRNSVMTGTPTEATPEDDEDDDHMESPASTRGRRGRRRGTPGTRKTTANPPGRRGRRRGG